MRRNVCFYQSAQMLLMITRFRNHSDPCSCNFPVDMNPLVTLFTCRLIPGGLGCGLRPCISNVDAVGLMTTF